MISFGVFLSIAITSILLAVVLFLIEVLLQKIWDIEEFTGSFWRVLRIIRKILICISVFSACIAVIVGIIYLIALSFNAGIWSV